MKLTTIEDLCAGDLVTISGDATACEAADRMYGSGVGCLVVMSPEGMAQGMVTDRDLALRAVLRPSAPESVRVSEIMTLPLVCMQADEGIPVAIELMKRNGIRRVVVERDGRPVGIVSLDALVRHLSLEMVDLGKESRDQARRAKLEGGVGRAQREVEEALHDVYSQLQYVNWYARESLLAQIDDLRDQIRQAVMGSES